MEQQLNNQKSESKKPFLTVVEISKFKTGVYVTEEEIILQDYEDKKNGVIIPFNLFKERAHSRGCKEDTQNKVTDTPQSIECETK